MIREKDHPQLEMLVDRLLVDILYLSIMIVADPLVEVVTCF